MSEFAVSQNEGINICDCVCSDVSISSSVREWLRSPAFDARQWEDEELLLMLQTMFVELDLPQKFNIPLPILRNFLYEVYNNYNEVPFHNFRHCFCVAQMASIYIYIYKFLSKTRCTNYLHLTSIEDDVNTMLKLLISRFAMLIKFSWKFTRERENKIYRK